MATMDCNVQLPCTLDGIDQTGLSTPQLAELALVLACALQHGSQDDFLARTLGEQLELTSTPAELLQAWIARCGLVEFASTCRVCPAVVEPMGDMTRVAEVAVALRCTMLRQLERRDAPRYTEFRACCDTGAETIATLCSTVGAPSNHRTADGNVLDGLRNGKGPEEFASVHRLRSKLRGSVRRLAEPEEAYWNAAEHAEAAQELCSSAQALVAAQGSAGAGALAAAVAAQLLTTVFDDLADIGYVAHKDRLLDILQEEVCPRLGIERHTTRALLAWAHLRQYLQQGDERMLAHTRDLLREAPGAPADGVNASQQAAARSAIHAELKQRAGDMFELCTAEQAPLVLDVVQLSAPTQEQQADAARELYLSSVDAELARCWASSAGLPGALASDGGAHVGNSGGAAPQRPRAEATRLYMMTVKEAIGRLRPFVKAFDGARVLHESAHLLLARQCHHRCGQRFKEWLRSEPLALLSHADVVRTAASFSAELRGAIEEDGGDLAEETAWADEEQLKPVLIEWLEEHRKEVLRLASAVCEGERWRESPAGGLFVADSAAELQRILAAAINSLLELDVPLHGAVVRLELDVLGEIAALYAQHVRDGCENPRQLVRPPPPLTRYKKSLSVKAQAGKDVLRLKELEANDPAYLAAVREYKRRMASKDNTELEPLLLRINSAHAVRASLAPLVADTQRRYARLLRAHRMSEERHGAALEGALRPAEQGTEDTCKCARHAVGTPPPRSRAVPQVLGEAAADVEEYLGHAAVFVKMADVWYDKLYQHNVSGRTASDVGVVAQLDQVMNQIMARASDGAKADTAAAVARAAFAALVTTLLHGGVFRNFTSDDADYLERDVRDLRALFHAGGEGVPDAQLEGVLAEVDDVVKAMSYATGLLVDSMDRVLGVQAGGKQNEGMPRACSDYDTLLCILSHRADRMASKYLKERRKMPKLDGKRRGLFF